ncbi:MAG: 23S rRNA (adenine(1618)-N(6))-methyltransferase RlmF [Parachlamydiaceae bacterium]|nr:23S rRNA (adenine(1618)-N(6))-methyltransferase RlmF [Parachlamydiaceae bacterium]
MTPVKKELHPRNPHRGQYDFKKLIISCPQLAKFVEPNKYGKESIDFANPFAVKTLNKAILKFFYNITWDIPEHYLCPPIPGRADYIHHVADLLCIFNKGVIPLGKEVKVLDIGVGANCIYPLIGHQSYGWSFVATDIDPIAIKCAEEIVKQNNLDDTIEIRLQKSSLNIFQGMIETEERYDISMCNPPFHSSSDEAKSAATRKNKNLGIKTKALNFGGKSNELWCPGGEVAFITQMIKESVHIHCKWFTALVSKSSSLPSLFKELDKIKPTQVKTLEMGQGQKISRIIAWTFLS